MFIPQFSSYLVLVAARQYFLLVAITIFSQTLPCSKATFIYSPLPPKIWLSEFIPMDSIESEIEPERLKFEKHFENEFLVINGSNYMVYNVYEMAFSCEAPYSVKWVFPHPEQLVDIEGFDMLSQGYRASTFNENLEKPLNKVFRIFLTISFRQFLSANLTCQSVGSPKKSSSIHLFVEDTIGMEKAGETIQINVSDSNPRSIVLPCRPSKPDMQVLLQKQILVNQSSTSWVSMIVPNSGNGFASFDPKFGFTLTRRQSRRERLFGFYKCTLDNGDDDTFVFVNVTQGDQKIIEFQYASNLKAKANVSLVYDRLNTYANFICCSGVPSKPPSVELIICSSGTDCDIKKYAAIARSMMGRTEVIYFHEDSESQIGEEDDGCSTEFVFDSSFIAFCEGDNVDFADNYITIFKQTDPNNGRYRFSFDRLSQLKTNNLKAEQKIAIEVGLPVSSKEELFDNTEEFHIVYSVYFNGGDHSTRVLKDLLDYQLEKQYIRIHYLDRPLNEGEDIKFLCSSFKYFYAYGGWLRLNWKNGTTTILEADYSRKIVYIENSVLLNETPQIISILSREVTASVEMDSVDCFMPVWDTSDWDMLRYSLQIQPSLKPRFTGADEKIVYFGLNETGHKISCEISEGTPLPSITIFKDGKLIDSLKLGKKQDVNRKNTINYQFTEGVNDSSFYSRTLVFSPISHDMHGEYVCKAENVKGKATKTFKVIVTEKSNTLKIILAIVVGILSVSLMLLGLKHWRQQMKI